MKIRDLNLDQYVIVYDIGKSEHSEGMTVVGRVHELVFKDESENRAMILSMGTLYIIYDNNYFDLWSNYIENKTEHIAFDKENTKKAKKLLSNDVQQRKRNDTVNHPSHYNYGEIEVIDYCDQVCKQYPPELAPYVFNAIKYLSRATQKGGQEDIGKAKYYVQRLFDKWDN
ncbi:DUF3310 domain-containing protein [Staphylococcus pseudoxylosus]|uniref:DUF3310 domain-containing protein n=1 Tax=Staphylococcus pseudoxylosus TaxID=2282419 RepID=UPI00398B0CBE